MKYGFYCVLLLIVSCTQKENVNLPTLQDVQTIERTLIDFHRSLALYYGGEEKNIDSLFSSLFADTAQYVTYWGTTEPIEKTKERIRQARGLLGNYSYRMEIVKIQVFENIAYAFFILRQSYLLQQDTVEEYLPTTFVLQKENARWCVIHAHRSADLETLQQIMKRASKKS